MSVTSGFFNSLNHDRRYSAQQMSSIFDGVINDGIFANIGVAFAVRADSGVNITIGEGKAWFNSAWVYNDALLPKTLEGSEVVLDRIDAVVIEVDHSETVRMGDVKIVKGTPSSSPQRPTMANETNKCQHPLAYVYRKAGSTEITQADITNMVGTSECPYITGILQVQNIDNIVAQWNAQWNEWYAEKIKETDSDSAELLAEMKSEFEIWFTDVQALLDDDAASALAAQVADLQGKFDDLAKNRCVYDTIEDSNLDVILGSDGTPIQGKTVFSEGGGNVDEGYVSGPLDMKGFPINGLNIPSSDDEAANKKYVDSEISTSFSRVSNPNLLDNWYFGNPVNQRGVTSGSTTYNAYNLDRWKWDYSAAAGTFSLGSDGITLTPGGGGALVFKQPFENPALLNGKKLTASALLSSGEFFSGTVTRVNGKSQTVATASNKFLIINAANQFQLSVYDSATILALKLELGSVQTLAHQDAEGSWVLNEIPNYSEQLARCQRFYQKSIGATTTTICYGNGYLFGFRLPVKMRAIPTILSCVIENPRVSDSRKNIDISTSRVSDEGFAFLHVTGATTDVSYVVKEYELSADL